MAEVVTNLDLPLEELSEIISAAFGLDPFEQRHICTALSYLVVTRRLKLPKIIIYQSMIGSGRHQVSGNYYAEMALPLLKSIFYRAKRSLYYFVGPAQSCLPV